MGFEALCCALCLSQEKKKAAVIYNFFFWLHLVVKRRRKSLNLIRIRNTWSSQNYQSSLYYLFAAARGTIQLQWILNFMNFGRWRIEKTLSTSTRHLCHILIWCDNCSMVFTVQHVNCLNSQRFQV